MTFASLIGKFFTAPNARRASARGTAHRLLLCELEAREQPGSLLDWLGQSALGGAALDTLGSWGHEPTEVRSRNSGEGAELTAAGARSPFGANRPEAPLAFANQSEVTSDGGGRLAPAAASAIGGPSALYLDNWTAPASPSNGSVAPFQGAAPGGLAQAAPAGGRAAGGATPSVPAPGLPAAPAPLSAQPNGSFNFYLTDWGTPANVNPADIASVPDQATAEGETVSLPIRLLQSPPAGATPTFTASGLPAGLSIDTQTGEITGIPFYTNAQTNGGEFAVSVTAAVGAYTDTETFNWSITDTNRIGALTDDFSQYNGESWYAPSLQAEFGVSDPFSYPLTVTVSGLPGGTISEYQRGGPYVVAGNLPDVTAVYTVTITATGGGATDTRTFKWHHFSSTAQAVLPAFNEINDTDDYESVGQTGVAGFWMFGLGTGLVTFDVDGPAEIVGPSSYYADYGYAGVAVRPTDVGTVVVNAYLNGVPLASKAFEGVVFKIETGTAAAPAVDKVRAASTPGAMKDRIPPRVDTTVTVLMKGQVPNGSIIAAHVEGMQDNNGIAAFNIGGGALQTANKGLALDLAAAPIIPNGAPNAGFHSLDVKLRGTVQTVPGNDGKLKFTIRDWAGGKSELKYNSAGFSVAAVPTALKFDTPNVSFGSAFPADVAGKYNVVIGATYGLVDVTSDSGKIDDLDQVKIAEVIIDKTATGLFHGASQAGSGKFITATDYKKIRDNLPIVQENIPAATGAAAIINVRDGVLGSLNNKPAPPGSPPGTPAPTTGTMTNEQFFVFVDARTGMNTAFPEKIANSGYVHTTTVTRVANDNYDFTVKKVPTANNGVAAGDITAAGKDEVPFNLKK